MRNYSVVKCHEIKFGYYAINRLEPKNVVVYGRMPDKIFCLAKMYGIKFMSFESEFGLSHKKGVN